MNKDSYDQAIHDLVVKAGFSRNSAIVGLRAGFRCVYCGRSVLSSVDAFDVWENDHVHPTSRGGPDEADNLVLSCRLCNKIKRAWVPDEWNEFRGGAALLESARSMVQEGRQRKQEYLDLVLDILKSHGILDGMASSCSALSLSRDVSGLEGPTAVKITHDTIECCYWTEGNSDPIWIELLKYPTEGWRTILDLPVQITELVTVGSFLMLFDNPDREIDDQLFRACTSLPLGPFSRWIAPLREPVTSPTASHAVAFEIVLPAGVADDGDVYISGGVPSARVCSVGSVDDNFWGNSNRFSWGPCDFALVDLAPLPIRIVSEGARADVTIRGSMSFRQLIQAVFHSCPPANHDEDLHETDRTRLGNPTFSPGVGSLRQLLGLEESTGR